MLLKDLMIKLEPLAVSGSLDMEIRGVTYDSRKALPKYLFVCIDGFAADGHQYAQQAVDNGATALIVEKDVSVIGQVTIIKVRDTREALASVSAEWFGNPSKNPTTCRKCLKK